MPVLKFKHNGEWQDTFGISSHTHQTDDITNFPSRLPNPNKLIIEGAVSAEYDGSQEVTLSIPEAKVWYVQASVMDDGMISLIDTTAAKVIDAIDSGTDVRLYVTISDNEVRYYHMDKRINDSYGYHAEFTYSNSDEMYVIYISYDGLNEIVGHGVLPIGNSNIPVDDHINNNDIHVTAEQKALWDAKADMDKIPISLKNPYKLTFTGGATGEYDGSASLEIDIPIMSDGYTPVKGVDYYTEDDKAEIVQMVIASLGGNPVFGYVDENNHIILSSNLADGTYSVKYELEDGSTIDIGHLALTEDEPEPDEPVQTYTNQIPISIDASGNPFNGGQGWKTGYRLSASGGGETAATDYECTGYIPVSKGDILRIKNVDMTSENATNIIFYDGSKTPIACNGANYGTSLAIFFGTADANNVYKGTITGTISGWTAPDNVAFIRIGSKSITADSILTVNQEIV